MTLFIQDKDQHMFEQVIVDFEKAFETHYVDFNLKKRIDYSTKDAVCHLFMVSQETIFKIFKWKKFATISKSRLRWNVNDYDIAKKMSEILDRDIIYSKTMLVLKHSYYQSGDVSIDHPRFKG